MEVICKDLSAWKQLKFGGYCEPRGTDEPTLDIKSSPVKRVSVIWLLPLAGGAEFGNASFYRRPHLIS